MSADTAIDDKMKIYLPGKPHARNGANYHLTSSGSLCTVVSSALAAWWLILFVVDVGALHNQTRQLFAAVLFVHHCFCHISTGSGTGHANVGAFAA